jgi:regulator of sirC expression with transglutaminase-like and TPR domain
MKAYRSEKKSPQALFAKELHKSDLELDLGRAALLIAKCEYPALDIEAYLQRFDQMAELLVKRLRTRTAQPSATIIIELINELLYQEQAFRGNTANYYDPKNSFLNEVLDRRIGIPITLSVIYIEIARRLGLKIEGVGMPGHFLLKYQQDGRDFYIDAFNQGRQVSEQECEQMLANIYGEGVSWNSSYLRVVSKKEIVSRMLSNLKNIYVSGGDYARALTIIERLLLIKPDSLAELRDRGLINFRLERFSAALNDLETYLAQISEGPEADNVRQYLNRIKSRLASLN